MAGESGRDRRGGRGPLAAADSKPGPGSQKTIMVAVPRPGETLTGAEAAGDDLARVPLPEGWEISLDVVEGPDRGRAFPISRTCMLIGRGKVDIPLDDSHASRRHASLEIYGSTCVLLKDLGSTNGTRVNGRSVVSVELKDGDIIELGTTKIVVTIGAPP